MSRNMPENSLGLESNIWYDRGAGNAYHTVRIIIDGSPVWTSPIEFGDNYEQTAKEWLNSNGLNIKTHLRIWAEDINNLEFDRRERKVNKRDLLKYNSFFPKREHLDSRNRWSRKIKSFTEDDYWENVDAAVEEYLDNEWRGTIDFSTGETPDEWDWDLLERLADVYDVNLEDIMDAIVE